VQECDIDVSSDESFSVSEDSDVVMAIRKKITDPPFRLCARLDLTNMKLVSNLDTIESVNLYGSKP
jgi:hypothetical protein